jgi:L-ascorbate metabolism protein UlaG (beta-lactamase superfamily)
VLWSDGLKFGHRKEWNEATDTSTPVSPKEEETMWPRGRQFHSSIRSLRTILWSSDSRRSSTAVVANADVSPTKKMITLQHRRDAATIQKLVQKRVLERSLMTTHQMMSLPEEKNLSFWQTLNEFRKFQVPSAEELDRTFPVLPMDWEQILHYPQNAPPSAKMQITWLSHSSLLVQFPNGTTLLTDPIWSHRCSPFPNWLGPQRYRPPPCTIHELLDRLPRVDYVLVSHNHYDHLDYPTIRAVYQKSPATHFVVPLGLRTWFTRYIDPHVSLYELDWYEYLKDAAAGPAPLQVTSLPMRHWSSRMGWDRDQTLWCGYSVELPGVGKFLYAGDTAWFDQLATVIGAEYGPFDVAALPIGAYQPRQIMKHNHVHVREAIRMKDAVRATAAVPIHWGTFPLTTEPVLEPRELLVQCMQERPDRDSFVPWLIGETRQF